MWWLSDISSGGFTVNDSSFTFWVIFVVTLVGSLVMLAMEDAEGAGVPYWEPEEYLIDENPLGSYHSSNVARGPDNIVRRLWQDDDYALMVSWTANNGSTWTVSEIVGPAWLGHTSLAMGGIVVLANNTTIAHFTTLNADDVYNSYVACRWNWTGPWDIIEIYGSAVNGVGYPKMAVNETCVLLTYYMTNAIRYKRFYPSNSAVFPTAAFLPLSWFPAADSNQYDYDVTVNQTGYFIIASKTWSGVSYRYYIRDLNGTHAVVYAALWSSVMSSSSMTIMSTSDDGFCLVMAIQYYGMNYYGIAVFHTHTPWGGFQYELIQYANNYVMDIDSVGTCIDSTDNVAIYWANDTGAGGGTYISKTRSHYQDDEVDWESKTVDGVYDYGTDDDLWRSTGWYDGKYPVVGGYSVNIPIAGWMGEHIWKDEVGTPDDYGFALYWNASFHMYDWEPEEPGPGGPGPGGGPDSVEDLFTNWDDELLGSLWILFALIALAATAIRETWTITRRGA
jgi:hypothetical protein